MKKGFTLIELLVVIAISSMLICLELTIISSLIFSYKSTVKNDREKFYIKDGLLFIESKAVNNESILIDNGNEILIKKTEYTQDRIIRYIYKIYLSGKGEIMIGYNEDGIDHGKNVITGGVKEFKVEIKKRILYIQIVSNGGTVFEKCIAIN